MQMERDGKDPQMQVAEVAQQSGTLLARDMDSEQAASMARGWVASSVSAQATDWLSRWGTAGYLLVWMKISALKALHLNFSIPGTKRRITRSSASTHFTVRMIALKPTTVSAGVISHRAGCLASICLSIMT